MEQDVQGRFRALQARHELALLRRSALAWRAAVLGFVRQEHTARLHRHDPSPSQAACF
jgi:hypothetical protein